MYGWVIGSVIFNRDNAGEGKSQQRFGERGMSGRGKQLIIGKGVCLRFWGSGEKISGQKGVEGLNFSL